MNFEKYLELRNGLMNEAETLIADGKLEESEAKMKEVKDLDNKWEEIKVANANLNALKDNQTATDIENKSEQVTGGQVVGTIKETVKDEATLYEQAWAKSLMGQDLSNDERNAFAKINNLSNEFTHTTVNTPTLIPDSVVAGITALMEEQYPLLADVRKFNVSGNLTMNRHDSIVAGDAAWYTEDVAVADEENKFSQFTLTGHELAKAVTVSWKMKSMAVKEFIPFIQREIASRMGIAKATAVSHGSGVNQPKGIVTVLKGEVGTPQVIEYAALAYENITNAISKIHSSLLNGVAIYANNSTIWNTLANLKDDVGRPLFIPDVSSGGVGRMFGRVVKADGSLQEGEILFGNADRGYILNTNEPMKLVTEDHAKPRETDYVAYEIVDGDVFEPKAFALLAVQEV
jgi:HK97 family phage major capsid protein